MPSPARVAASVLAAYIALLGAAWVLFSRVVLASHLAFEEESVADAVRRADLAIAASLEGMEGTAGDWSGWDATHEFMEDRNPAYLEENQTDKAYRDLDLDLMVYVALDREVVFARHYDHAAGRARSPPTEILTALLRQEALFAHPDDHPRVSGVVATPGGLFLVSAAPILTSEGEGPARGTLILARAFDGRTLGRLSRTTHLEVSLGPAADLAGGVRVRPLDDGSVLGEVEVRDVAGERVATLRAGMPRTVYARGRYAVRLLLLSLAGAGWLAAALFGWVFLRYERTLVQWQEAERRRRAGEEAVQHAALHDALTGLPNRRLFSERLADALTAATFGRTQLAVFFLDLDGFKDVNDTLGHDVADRVLVEVGRRLSTLVRAEDTVARQGGDEFLLLFPGLSSEAVAPVAERILSVLRPRHALEGREVVLSASLGVATFPRDGADATTLVASADMAMYQAKASGRNTWRSFEPTSRLRAARSADLRGRLSRALEAEAFRLEYQPLISLVTGRIVAVEALLRWDTERGPIPPLEFVPIAEQSGLIVPLGAWVLRTATRQARAWNDAGAPPVRVAVNLSTRQFLGEPLERVVLDALHASGLPPSQLELEVTESLAIANPELTRRALGSLRAAGVAVALDDFGTGHSSLALLRELPLDRIKIDRSFLHGAVESPRERAIVSAIVSLAHAVNLGVVAEGVETRAQLELVRAERCDQAQGHGIARPLRPAACLALLGQSVPLVEAPR